jgi:hypothetical protein
LNAVDETDKRILKILGEDAERTWDSAERYRAYLQNLLDCPPKTGKTRPPRP